MRLILLGPPGSGKGTQSKLLCRRLNLEHIGTGDLLRAAIRDRTPVGERARQAVESGQLVPDELVNDLIAEYFARPNPPSCFVMDGYPRTLAQAQAFDRLLSSLNLPLTSVLLIAVQDSEIVARMSGRWSCPQLGCKATYHVDSNPPHEVGICDECGATLVQRPDDKIETVRHRLIVYHRDTEALVDFYSKRGLLHTVDGRAEIEEVYNQLTAALGL
jgi:adenylate kinase